VHIYKIKAYQIHWQSQLLCVVLWELCLISSATETLDLNPCNHIHCMILLMLVQYILLLYFFFM